jgi:hypothetical protein
MDSRSDELLILDVLYRQSLPRSKNYLNEKTNAIASMAAARPSKAAFAAIAPAPTPCSPNARFRSSMSFTNASPLGGGKLA